MTPWYEGKNTPGLFVLGTASHSRDYRSSAGGFVHGFRYTGDRLLLFCDILKILSLFVKGIVASDDLLQM